MISALKHCSHPVTIHLLYDAKLSIGKEEEEIYTKECYQKIARLHDDCDIQYHHVELPKWIEELPCIKKWTPGAMLRLYLPELLPNQDKIIYLDCDTVILTNIINLWDTNLGKVPLAACYDGWMVEHGRKRMKYYESHGIPLDKYFNSGVLLLNLKEMRNSSRPFLKTVLDYLSSNPNLLYPDQDLLNWFCNGNYVLLDKKYDVFSWWNDAMEYTDDCIIHYSTANKPWKKYNGDIDEYYWDYLRDTPWCENRREFIRYVRLAPDTKNALQYYEQNFLEVIEGSRWYKIKKLFTFTISIWKSPILWLRNMLKNI